MKKLASWMFAVISLGCGLQQCTSTRQGVQPVPDAKQKEIDAQAATGVVEPEVKGPKLEVFYSNSVNALNLIEKASSWRPALDSNVLQVLDHRVGLEPDFRDALKKFGFMRSRLENKSVRDIQSATFEEPFGPEGLFPKSSDTLVEHFWESMLEVEEVSRTKSGLKDILTPADEMTVAFLMPAMTACIDKLGNISKFADQSTTDLTSLLLKSPVGEQLEAFGRFLGVDASILDYLIHPVWIPDYHHLEAQAYGNRILVSVPETKGAGIEQAALAVHEIARRMVSMMHKEKKSAYTIRFVEQAGYDGRIFYLLEGVLDAFSHGLVAPLLGGKEKIELKWPGDENRQKYAQALVPLLGQYLEQKKHLDMGFVNQAAKLCRGLFSPKPADYLDGAMVIGREESIQAFKSQVVRWTVWKFPLMKQYNYSKKLSDNPGKSVLLLALYSDLELVRSRLGDVSGMTSSLDNVARYLVNNKKVFLSLPREHRGYFFILVAPTSGEMKKLARAFYELNKMPYQAIVLD